MTHERAILPTLLALILTPALAIAAEDFVPPAPHVDKPLYAASRAGLEHFAQDELSKLIGGQEWDWNGHAFAVERVHRVKQSWVTRAKQANRDYSAPVRGWLVAEIHVRVDGQLLTGRIEANASYLWHPAGWAWEQVLLELGRGDSWDFVTRTVR